MSSLGDWSTRSRSDSSTAAHHRHPSSFHSVYEQAPLSASHAIAGLHTNNRLQDEIDQADLQADSDEDEYDEMSESMMTDSLPSTHLSVPDDGSERIEPSWQSAAESTKMSQQQQQPNGDADSSFVSPSSSSPTNITPSEPVTATDSTISNSNFNESSNEAEKRESDAEQQLAQPNDGITNSIETEKISEFVDDEVELESSHVSNVDPSITTAADNNNNMHLTSLNIELVDQPSLTASPSPKEEAVDNVNQQASDQTQGDDQSIDHQESTHNSPTVQTAALDTDVPTGVSVPVIDSTVAQSNDDTAMQVSDSSASLESTLVSPSIDISSTITSVSPPPPLTVTLASSTFHTSHTSALQAVDLLATSISNDIQRMIEDRITLERSFQTDRQLIAQTEERVRQGMVELSTRRQSVTHQHAQLEAAVRSSVERLEQLRAHRHDLESRHTFLLSARSHRLVEQYLDAHPTLTFLRMNDGVRRGAHRKYQREVRREARLAQRQMGGENIHHMSSSSEDDTDEEEDETQPSKGEATNYVDPEEAELAHLSSLDLSTSSFVSSPPFPPRRYGSSVTTGPNGSSRVRLPVNVFEHIFLYLGVIDLQRSSCVCRDWRNGLIGMNQSKTWRKLMQRVMAVEERLRVEREAKEKEMEQHQQSERTATIAKTNRIDDSTSLSSSPSVAYSPSITTLPSVSPSSLPMSSSFHLSSSPPSTSLRPVANGSSRSPSLSVSSTPSTSRGLLGGMLKRIRGSVSTPATAPHTSSATDSTTAANPSSQSFTSPTPSPPSTKTYHPMHLHYSLTIEIVSRESTVLHVVTRMAESSLDGRWCGEDSGPESEKGNNSVTLHLCPLRLNHQASKSGHVPSTQDDLEFCQQLVAIQANLTQVKIERGKILAQIDGDEGLKKEYTNMNAQLTDHLHQFDLELDRLHQQRSSDMMTHKFLSEQLLELQSNLENERRRSKEVEVECKNKLEAARRELTQTATPTPTPTQTPSQTQSQSQPASDDSKQQQELYHQLKSQKRQLTKEVKTIQLELEEARRAHEEARLEYESLLHQIQMQGGDGNSLP